MLPILNTFNNACKLPLSKKEINYRPFLVSEQKELMAVKESDNVESIFLSMKSVINNCLKTKLDVDQLPITDVIYTFLKLRAASVGNKIELSPKCVSCGEHNDVKIDIEKVTIGKEPNKSIALSDNCTINLEYPQFKHFKIITKIKDDDVESFDALLTLLGEVAQTLVFNGEVYSFKDEEVKEKIKFFDGLTTDQLSKLSEFISQVPDISIVHDYKCSHCESDNKIVIEGMTNFF